MTKTILIAGGSGLIGQQLAQRLIQLGHEVRILSRRNANDLPGAVFQWDIDKGWIDPDALKDLDVLINLAGAGIADKKWSAQRKDVLRKSRLAGNILLLNTLEKQSIQPELFLGASAIGIYGNQGEKILDEFSEHGPSSDYLVELCEAWEQSQSDFAGICQRVVSIRIGLVLSMEGGALPPLYKSVIFGIGAILGSGDQYMSWIHLDDLIQMFVHAIDHEETNGVINGTAPAPVTHSEFIRAIVHQKGGLGITFKIPAFILEGLMGEMAQILLEGARVISAKMEKAAFTYQYVNLSSALQDLLRK